jgi:hypothetical protein
MAEQNSPDRCAHATFGQSGDVDAEKPPVQGKNLSDKLARSNGIVCPPPNVDPDIKQPTPPGGAIQIIPPPGSRGGEQRIVPK